MKKIILVITAIVVISCSNKSGSSNKIESIRQEQQQATPKKDSVDFSLVTFTDIPNEIDGCGCYFYLSKEDEKNEKYLFVNDFASIAYVAINGNVEKFELKEHKENSTFYFYSNGYYDLKVEVVKKENGGNETSIMEGKIILSKGDKVIERSFVGTCGC